MQVAYDYRHLAHRSAKCKSISAIWRTAPRNARAFPPFGERLREMQEHFCHLANISCNLRETGGGGPPRPCKSRTIIAIWRTAPRNARAFPPVGETLLQLAGDYRTPTNISCNLRETIVPLRTISCNLRETFVPLRTISCNLRETFVPLQTSPAICGRLSYPYIPSPATCGRLSYPYEKVLQHFFRL